MDDLCQPVIILDNDRFKPKKKKQKKKPMHLGDRNDTDTCVYLLSKTEENTHFPAIFCPLDSRAVDAEKSSFRCN